MPFLGSQLASLEANATRSARQGTITGHHLSGKESPKPKLSTLALASSSWGATCKSA